MNPEKSRRLVLFAVLFLAASVAPVAWSQVLPEQAITGAVWDGNADDIERGFQYARNLADQGQPALAAAVLETLIYADPSLYNLRAELGILYLVQLGSPELARENLILAMDAPNVPPSVTPMLARYVALAENMRRRNTVSFEVSAGYRDDDNVNASPSNPDVLAFGFPALLSADSLARDDQSFNLSANGEHAFWFGDLARHNLSTEFEYFGSRYDIEDGYDLNQLRVRIGPDLALTSGAFPRSRLHLFVQDSSLDLGGEKYLDASGFGARLSTRIRGRWEFAVDYTMEDRDFRPTSRRPFVEDRDGDNALASASITYRAPANWYLSLGLLDEDNESAALYESYSRNGSFIGLGKSFSMRGGDRFWSVGLSAFLRDSNYLAPDVAVDPYTARSDSRTDVHLYVSIPVSRSFAVRLDLDDVDNESNIPNTTYQNSGTGLTFLWYH